VLGGFLSWLATPAWSQTPVGVPLRLIVPFTPGTGPDLIARQLAPGLSEREGRPVVVENKPGASGNIGTQEVVRARPDGNTLLVTVSTLVMARALYPTLSFDPAKDLWAAAGFKDTLLRWKMKPEVVHGEKKDIQPRVQARGGQAGH